MIYKPQIIAQVLSTQSAYIGRLYGQMFYYTDKGQLWCDTLVGGRVYAADIQVLRTERERNNYIPDNVQSLEYAYVYIVETNSLYGYNFNSRTWVTVYGRYGSSTVAQTYLPNGELVEVNADDVSTNGILNDGSVVVRDANKMICGLLSSDGYTFNIRGLIGEQINIDPSGTTYGNGCLQVNVAGPTCLNNDLVIFGDIKATSKSNWKKQYRLITEAVSITSTTLIKAGSYLAGISEIEGRVYNDGMYVTEDINTDAGLIAAGSKIYIDSIINGEPLKPPYLFDTEVLEENIKLNKSVDLYDDLWDIQGEEDGSNKTIMAKINSPFSISGDCAAISLKTDISDCKHISFNDGKTYNVSYITEENTGGTARIVYYGVNNTVKILP